MWRPVASGEWVGRQEHPMVMDEPRSLAVAVVVVVAAKAAAVSDLTVAATAVAAVFAAEVEVAAAVAPAAGCTALLRWTVNLSVSLAMDVARVD